MTAKRLGIPVSLFLILVTTSLEIAADIPVRPLKGLRADVAALVLSGREGGALHAAMLAVPLPTIRPEGKPRVGLWIEIDGARLINAVRPEGEPAEGEPAEEVPADSLRVEVHAYAMRPGGGLAGSLSESFRLPRELVANLGQGGVKYRASLELEPGEYELRVLVRETESQRYVLRFLPLRVPAPAEPQALATPPLFPDAPTAWMAILGPDLPLSPAVLPVLPVGQPLKAGLLVHGDQGREPQIKARILDAQRQPLKKVDARLVPRQPPNPESAGARHYELAFELPDDLLTGNYFLETSLEMQGRGSPSAQTETTQIYALGLERGETAVIWTDLQHLASLSARRHQALDLAAEKRASKRIATIVQGYREVLKILATGNIADAVQALSDLETEVLESKLPESEPEGSRAWLTQAQDQLLTALAQADAESLIPVLFMHMEGHDAYVRDDRRALTFHARERIIAAARLYAKHSASELAAELAARALADMGGALGQAGLRVAARRMFGESMALDPRNTTASLGVALDQERRGEYHQAATSLRHLLEIEPTSEEARLRLAVNLRRSGETTEAGRHLRRLLADGGTEWLLGLAYQELAKHYLTQGRPGEAVRLLEAGIRRLPKQQRLFIQLIHALERLGESGRARDILQSVPTGRPEASPRLRYGHQIRVDLDASRSELMRQSLARLAILSAALPEGKK